MHYLKKNHKGLTAIFYNGEVQQFSDVVFTEDSDLANVLKRFKYYEDSDQISEDEIDYSDSILVSGLIEFLSED